jgi:hypothetical protein
MGCKIAPHNILVRGKSNLKISGFYHFDLAATGMLKYIQALLLDIIR